MMEFQELSASETNEENSSSQALSVSAALVFAKSTLQQHTFKILGEISELSDKPGYKAVYFTIKDDKSSLPCLMWRNRYDAAQVLLSIGSKVEVVGKFSIYLAKGRMNFDVFSLTLAGEGNLRLQVARLAEKLKAEGLMDASKKRPIPLYPTKVGLVTSPHGAAVHDVLRTMRRRFPAAEILFAGVPVEGKQAPSGLIQALNVVANAGAEVVLLVRGGGSFEDLMPFNDEQLARAIFALPLCVVTGIGHEPDTSIADMVADVRASTPTAAAEAVVPDQSQLDTYLIQTAERISHTLSSRLGASFRYLESIASRPSFANPYSLVEAECQTIDYLQNRLEKSLVNATSTQRHAYEQIEMIFKQVLPRFMQAQQSQVVQLDGKLTSLGKMLCSEHRTQLTLYQQMLRKTGSILLHDCQSRAALMASRLDDLSPVKTLKRGWSIATDSHNAVINSVEAVTPGDRLSVLVADGSIDCEVKAKDKKDRFEFTEG